MKSVFDLRVFYISTMDYNVLLSIVLRRDRQRGRRSKLGQTIGCDLSSNKAHSYERRRGINPGEDNWNTLHFIHRAQVEDLHSFLSVSAIFLSSFPPFASQQTVRSFPYPTSPHLSRWRPLKGVALACASTFSSTSTHLNPRRRATRPTLVTLTYPTARSPCRRCSRQRPMPPLPTRGHFGGSKDIRLPNTNH